MIEIPIVKVTPAANPKRAQPFKGPDNTGREAFIIDVDYHLEDGRIINCTVSSRRKKDLPDRLAREQTSAQARCLFASFTEDGQYFGTVSKWVIGGSGGLVPATQAA